MKGLREKFRKNEGFTMVELLIVVAIIAILVAVSIPMMNQALEKSRHAVDQANVRDAIGLASVKYLTDGDSIDSTTGKTYSYCVDDENQGYLMETLGEDDKDKVVKPQCTCNGEVKNEGLTVTIKAPADPNAEGARPDISTSWYYNTTSGKTEKPATTSGGGTGGGGGEDVGGGG